MEELRFTPIEESVSFYTRNDFILMNALLVGDEETLWDFAPVAYGDNLGILKEYKAGVRTIEGDYDVKWIACLKKRLLNQLDEETKKMVIRNARTDIQNILGAMEPAGKELLLYRTAWEYPEVDSENAYPFAWEYKSLPLSVGKAVDIAILSSTSLTPYREKEEGKRGFWRYEITVPAGNPVLLLDQFVTHNEDGEVILPPMRCRVMDMIPCQGSRCKGVIKLLYLSPLKGMIKWM